jgi:hypothetical protein
MFVPVSGAADAAASQIGDGTDSLFRMGMGLCGRLAPWLAGAWSLGVAVCLLRLMRGCLWVRRIRWRQTEPAEPGWLETLEDLRVRLDISRHVGLFKSALVQVPTVIGWMRPIVLLPAATLAGLAPEQLEAILAHELAHVRRFDCLVNACQCALETLMFYHPAVWWVSRCVREERENCCDDLVVQVCGNRLAYARALAVLAQSSAGLPELAFAANGAPLLARIRRLLGVGNEVMEQSPGNRGWTAKAAANDNDRHETDDHDRLPGCGRPGFGGVCPRSSPGGHLRRGPGGPRSRRHQPGHGGETVEDHPVRGQRGQAG